MNRISERIAARLTGSRGEARALRYHLIEIFDDDGGIDHDVAVVVEGRHHAVRIELEILGLKLLAGQQIEFFIRYRLVLDVVHEANALRAGRVRSVVKLV